LLPQPNFHTQLVPLEKSQKGLTMPETKPIFTVYASHCQIASPTQCRAPCGAQDQILVISLVSHYLGAPPLTKEWVCPLLASPVSSTFVHIYSKCLFTVVEKL
jgi:hypothetical protein